MSKKVFKRVFTKDDVAMLERYVAKNGVELLIETWEDQEADGVVHTIKPPSLGIAIVWTDKCYDAISSSNKSAELLMRDKSGDYTCLYHISRNRSGLTYEVLKYAKGY